MKCFLVFHSFCFWLHFYCNDLCWLHVHSFPPLGWQQEKKEMSQRNDLPVMREATVSKFDRSLRQDKSISK